eukprot:1158022-Pelagomonas_calceolata.AAC.4
MHTCQEERECSRSLNSWTPSVCFFHWCTTSMFWEPSFIVALKKGSGMGSAGGRIFCCTGTAGVVRLHAWIGKRVTGGGRSSCVHRLSMLSADYPCSVRKPMTCRPVPVYVSQQSADAVSLVFECAVATGKQTCASNAIRSGAPAAPRSVPVAAPASALHHAVFQALRLDYHHHHETITTT